MLFYVAIKLSFYLSITVANWISFLQWSGERSAVVPPYTQRKVIATEEFWRALNCLCLRLQFVTKLQAYVLGKNDTDMLTDLCGPELSSSRLVVLQVASAGVLLQCDRSHAVSSRQTYCRRKYMLTHDLQTLIQGRERAHYYDSIFVSGGSRGGKARA
jgi:hypothetical protein